MKLVGKMGSSFSGFIDDNTIYSFNGYSINETDISTLQSTVVLKFPYASSICKKDNCILIVNTSGKIYVYDLISNKKVNFSYRNAQEGSAHIFSKFNDCCLFCTLRGHLVFFNSQNIIKEHYFSDIEFNDLIVGIYEYSGKLVVRTIQKLLIYSYTNLEEAEFETTIPSWEHEISFNSFLLDNQVYIAPAIEGRLIKFDLEKKQWDETEISVQMCGAMEIINGSKFGVAVLDTNGLNVYNTDGENIYHYGCEEGASLFGNEKYLVLADKKTIIFSY